MADGISYGDMLKMQSEAVQRVKEMQRRAKYAVERANAQKSHTEQQRNFSQTPPKGKNEAPQSFSSASRMTSLPLDYLEKPSKASADSENTHDNRKKSHEHTGTAHTPQAVEAWGEAFNSSNKDSTNSEGKEQSRSPSPAFSADTDSDVLIILLLIILLSGEDADNMMLMALGYILM